MACVVYCLVPDPEQLDPLIERLKDAGVKTEDIAVVPRRHWPQACPPAPRPDSPAAVADAFSPYPYLWNLSVASAAFWWQWALNGQATTAWLPRADGHAVIPLQVYETKRTELKRK